jgi:hypothetical protein
VREEKEDDEEEVHKKEKKNTVFKEWVKKQSGAFVVCVCVLCGLCVCV